MPSHFVRRADPALRMILLSVLLGIIGAVSAQLFQWILEWAHELLIVGIGQYDPPTVVVASASAPQISVIEGVSSRLMIPVATVAGALLSGFLVYRFAPEAQGHGTDAVIAAYHTGKGVIRGRVAVVKTLASACTIGAGGAAGREGPIAQTAGAIGSWIALKLGLAENERRYLLLIGAAAGLAAIFKSPLGAALFVVKVLYSGLALEAEVLGFTIIAAATSYAFTGLFEGWQPLFLLPPGLALNGPTELLWFAGLGITTGVSAAALPTVFYRMRDGFRQLPLPQMLRPAVGALILGAGAILLPEVLGGGYGWIQYAINGDLPVLLLLVLAVAKVIAMGLTVGSGGSGGVFAPTLFVGAMIGAAFAAGLTPILGGAPPAASLTVVGMAALFAGAARVPLAALIMVVEMSGGYGLLVPTMVAVILSTQVQDRLTSTAKYKTLYEAQVARPQDSPSRYEEYARSLSELLSHRRIKLERDLLTSQATETLLSGVPMPIRGTGETLFVVAIGERSPLEGSTLAEAQLPSDTLIVSIFRGDRTIIPTGQTTLVARDRVAVVASQVSAQAFRAMAKNEGNVEDV